ncbi:MAG: hypothetical protein ACTH58_16610 [Marinomonas foliarum]|uniref:hypothetical protein n=1 Tax=Marinomonas foliarum TaxID=491950 RepID=UPI003F98A904
MSNDNSSSEAASRRRQMDRYLESAKLEGIELKDIMHAMFDLFEVKGWNADQCVGFLKAYFGYEVTGSDSVNPDDLDAEEQEAFFEEFAVEMWKQPTPEEDAAFLKRLGQGTLVGVDENDNLICSVMVKASGSKDYFIQLPEAVADELEVKPGDRVEFCIGDAMVNVWKHSTGKKS